MPVLVVAVGQCGNQLADELFTQLSVIQGINSSSSSESSKRDATFSAAIGPEYGSAFFTRDSKARLVLVDAEPKVVYGVLKRHPQLIRPENVVCGQSGRGNNWGLGYHGVNDPNSKRTETKSVGTKRAFQNLQKSQRIQDDGLLANTLRAIHAETRRTSDGEEEFEAVVLLHSLSGGTGSGLASHLAERIRLYFVGPEGDELFEEKQRRIDGIDGMLVEKRRAKYLLSICLAPMALGELATQGINAALTLQVLMKTCDAVLLLRNDDAISGADGSAVPLYPKCMTFKEVNELMVAALLPVFHYGLPFRGKSSPVTSTLHPSSADISPVEALIRQCAPGEGHSGPKTGANRLLTLVPTPQRTYGRFHQSANRIRFYALYEGKLFMPGCEPELPHDSLLSHTAAGNGEESGGGGKKGRSGRRSTWQSGGTRARHPAPFTFGTLDPEEPSTDRPDAQKKLEEVVFDRVNIKVPKAIRDYYATLCRSPTSSFFQVVEGIAVLNQARELCASLLFPLLRSAALKVKVGAYVGVYSDAGVSCEMITKAYRSVAEAMIDAEEIP